MKTVKNLKKWDFCLLIQNYIEEEEQYANKAMLVISHKFDLYIP